MPRSGAPPSPPEPAAVQHQGHGNQQPRQEGNAGRPLAGKLGTKGGTCRPWLTDGRGRAWSKRPDRQAGRHGRKRPPLRGANTGTNHARPTSRPPAQPGACARHAGTVRGDRKAAKTVYQEEGRPEPCPKRAARHRRGRRAGFQGVGQGSELVERARACSRRLALNLSCFQEKQSVSSGKARFRAANHSPPPLASEGSESPSVVRDAGGGALRFLRLHPRLEALAVPVASRVRLRPRPHPFGARPAGCAPRAASGRALDTPSTRKPGAGGRGRGGDLSSWRLRPGGGFRPIIRLTDKNNNSIIIILITTRGKRP